MSFDPTKPCVTRTSRYPVTIHAVHARDTELGYRIVGSYIDSGGALCCEQWTGTGHYSTNRGETCLDLVNVLEPPKYVVSGRCVLRVIDGSVMGIVVSNLDGSEAELVCAALNAYGR